LKSLAGTSRRLSYDHGQWSLETSELVRLDRDLYRPERRRIEGPDAIFAHLRSKGEGALLHAAERLVRISDHEGCTYEAMDGEWVVAEPSIPPGRPSRSDQLGDEVAELRAEVVMLRAAYSGLASRLRKLEGMISGAGSRKASLGTPIIAAAASDAVEVREAAAASMSFGQTLEAGTPAADAVATAPAEAAAVADVAR
jgi:hypothetical protein